MGAAAISDRRLPNEPGDVSPPDEDFVLYEVEEGGRIELGERGATERVADHAPGK